jgi:putative N6-adenine-specific DNA methylase
MCGSGTIAVEAALFASNTPPGKFRKSFGFQKWSGYDQDLFSKFRSAESLTKPSLEWIFCSDVSGEAVELSETNIRSAPNSPI